MKKRIVVPLLSFSILLSALYVHAGLDSPHDASNNINCSSCHFESGNPPPWFTETPDPNNPDTNYSFNRLCWSCHNDVIAPFEKTHSNFAMNGVAGWSRECRDCHHAHNQRQFRRWGSESYLYSGPSTAVTANTITRTGAGWTADQWKGMLVIGNIAYPNFNYRITFNTADTLTVQGTINTAYVGAGNTFAISYGKLVRDVVNGKNVKFFRQTGANSFADGDSVYDGICEVCHTATTYHRNDTSGDHTHNTASNCVVCHTHKEGFRASCDGCHDAPPASGAHLKHFGATPDRAGYGNTSITRDFSPDAPSYIMNCGNCHPLDEAMHINGTVEVELHNASSPPGSLKAKNPASAAYTPGGTVYTDGRGFSYTLGTCSSIYCHSYAGTTSGPVGDPLVDVYGDPIMGADCNLTYDPYTVTQARVYQSPAWGDTLACAGCHGMPTTTSYPGVEAGVGDSHQWIDDYGYGNLHMFNMASGPISCSYCHNDTVRQLNTWSRDSMDVVTMHDVRIDKYSRHVNGTADVAFDRTNPFAYPLSDGSTYDASLAAATYDSSTKTCSNIACHYDGTGSQGLYQQTATWGSPYRWFNWTECDLCHRKGLPSSCP